MQHIRPPATADLGEELSPLEFANIIQEAILQPQWRATADKEADYCDGNQLNSDLLKRMETLGIPPAKENIIGPAIAAVCGYEAKMRKDWRISPDGDPDGQDVADALNYRINQAERHSKADAAMSQAFKPQVAVGLGWVEVARNSNPLEYKNRCRYIHRNEIFWDMRAKETNLIDARWLVRERYMRKEIAASTFTEYADLIMQAQNVSGMGGYGGYTVEGGVSTGLHAGAETPRAWTTREQAWYRRETDEVCISEVWYRRWVSVMLMVMGNGRVIEFDESNVMHRAAVAMNSAKLMRSTVARVRRAYFMGPHRLHDSASPYPHPYFPYVPFWGMKEDMTGIPFGLVRDMLYPQDNLNSTLAKLRWGMTASRIERTKNAVAMSDDQLRRQVARPDSDIVLNQEHMARPGAKFEVKRDFQLNNQQFQMMNDSRASLERVGRVTASFQGQKGSATSGLQEQTQVEQSQVGLASLMDSFEESRALVGEILLALEIEDMGEERQVVVIEGDTLNPTRTVVLNDTNNDEFGQPQRTNDVLRTRLKVALEDVPKSSSFRAQQLASFSETIKSLPPQAQIVLTPFMVDLMDMARKKQVMEAIRDSMQQGDPAQAMEQAKKELQYDLKTRELDLREREIAAKEKLMSSQQVQTGVQAAYSAMQAGAQIAANPLIAPLADAVMQGAGYQTPSPGGDDPNFPTPQSAAMQQPAPQAEPLPMPTPQQAQTEQGAAPMVHANTSPAYPPVPQQPGTGMQGIETPSTTDNL